MKFGIDFLIKWSSLLLKDFYIAENGIIIRLLFASVSIFLAMYLLLVPAN